MLPPYKARKVSKQKYTTVICLDPPGDGNACHIYNVLSNNGGKSKINAGGVLGVVYFQHGPIKENGVNGVQNEDLLSIVIDRLEGFQSGDFACKENSVALEFCRNALKSLSLRTIKREVRGVEGTHIK